MNPIEELGSGIEEGGLVLDNEMVREWRMGEECSSGRYSDFCYLEISVFEVYYHVERND
jgi:hypothetical protein